MSEEKLMSPEVIKVIHDQQRRIELGTDSSDHAYEPDGWLATTQRWADLDAKDRQLAEEIQWERWLQETRELGITPEEASDAELWGYYTGHFDPDRPFVAKLQALESMES